MFKHGISAGFYIDDERFKLYVSFPDLISDVNSKVNLLYEFVMLPNSAVTKYVALTPDKV